MKFPLVGFLVRAQSSIGPKQYRKSYNATEFEHGKFEPIPEFRQRFRKRIVSPEGFVAQQVKISSEKSFRAGKFVQVSGGQSRKNFSLEILTNKELLTQGRFSVDNVGRSCE
jgi:hypothetical protein